LAAKSLRKRVRELERELDELRRTLLVKEPAPEDPALNIPSGVELRAADVAGEKGQFLMSQGPGTNPKWENPHKLGYEYDPPIEIPAIDAAQDYLLIDSQVTTDSAWSFYICPARQFPSNTSAKFVTPIWIVNFNTSVPGLLGIHDWTPPRGPRAIDLPDVPPIQYFRGGTLYYSSGGVPMRVVALNLSNLEFGNLPEYYLFRCGLGGSNHYGVFRISHATYANKALISQGATLMVPTDTRERAWHVIENILPGYYCFYKDETSTTAVETLKVDLGASYTLARASLGMNIDTNYGSVSFEYSADDVTYTVIASWAAGETGIVFPYVDNVSARYLRVTQAGDGTSATRVNFYKMFAWA